MAYAELHALSNFSFLRGASHPAELIRQAHALGYRALALTDECSFAGIVRAHETAKELGFKLIVGSEFRLACGLKLVLLAPDHAAYSEICRLITRARRRSEKGCYRLDRADLEHGLEHVLTLWVPGPDCDESQALWIRERFPHRAWIAIELHRDCEDAIRLDTLQGLGRGLGLPLVATGDVHYHLPQRRYLQDVLTAIRLGKPVGDCGRELFPNGERHLRSLPMLEELHLADCLSATLEIAERCNFTLDQLHYEYPRELVPDGLTSAVHLRNLTEAGLQHRWPAGVPPKVRPLIEKELEIISELKYESFFLTVADLVEYARSQDILCQGRGSAANSAVCYALGVTEVDPDQSSVLFERFVSRERNEPPDIDVDFEHQRREEVIQYVYRKYGRERAALAATVICYRPRSAVRDVGKALGLSLDQIDALSKSLAWWDGTKKLPARLREIGFDPASPLMRQLLWLVKEILGFPRHLSQHVGGFVISEHPLWALVPVENAAMPERTIIQWDKDDLEALGLLKVDCLALGMLSAIHRSLDLVARHRGLPRYTMQDIPKEDKATYDMISAGKTIGVFQIESRAQMGMLPRLKPEKFYDLVIQIAIVRPGPIQGGMVHPYLRRRQGLEKVDYPSKALEQVMKRTLGIPLFQEQVMQVAVVAAGFTPGEADQVRRSMAAWQRKGGLEHLQERLVNGMLNNGYSQEFAHRIFEMIKGFGDYGFPESHAASFAILAYISSWLKRHEPAAFLAGLLNSQPMGFYQPAQLINDARHAGLEIRPVDVLTSEWDCTLEPITDASAAVRLGFRMVSGIAEAEALRISATRRQHLPSSLDELAHRATLSKRVLQQLADAGALARLTGQRNQSRWAALGTEHLPGFLSGASAQEPPPTLPIPSEGQDLVADFRSMGLTLGRHPLALLRTRLRKLGCTTAAELPQLRNGQSLRLAGIVTHRQRPETASGVMFVTLEDETGFCQLIVWPGVLEAQRRPAILAQLMLIHGSVQVAQDVVHLIAERIEDKTQWLGEITLPSRDFH